MKAIMMELGNMKHALHRQVSMTCPYGSSEVGMMYWWVAASCLMRRALHPLACAGWLALLSAHVGMLHTKHTHDLPWVPAKGRVCAGHA
eukprot:244035-Amphidinium_carterae.2